MSFTIKPDKIDTENKTIRIPVTLINRIEKEMLKFDGKLTFSGFVIQAIEHALDEIDSTNEKNN